VFSERLLAGLRALHGEDQEVHDDDTFQDPDDRVDPDDSGPRLSVPLKKSRVKALPAARAEQTSECCAHTMDQSKAPQSPPKATAGAAGVPALPDLLDPAVLRTMPPKVAAFMMYEPADSPPWRTKPPPDGMDEGSWCG
jgi:hypothetical protein